MRGGWGAVAFRIYDLGTTGVIERSEVKRFLVALLKDNPDIHLDEAGIESIIDQVSLPCLLSQSDTGSCPWTVLGGCSEGRYTWTLFTLMHD